MTKTQVMVPDELYAKAKEIAQAKEWSLAEVFRRGLEYMAETHHQEDSLEEWELPKLPAGHGKKLSAAEFEELLQQEREEQLAHKIGLDHA